MTWRAKPLGWDRTDANPDLPPANSSLPEYVTGDVSTQFVPSLKYTRYSINNIDVDPDTLEEISPDTLMKSWLKWDIEHGDKFGAGRKHGHEIDKGDVIHHDKWGPVEVTSARKVDPETGNRLLVVKDKDGKLHSAPIHKDEEVHVGTHVGTPGYAGMSAHSMSANELAAAASDKPSGFGHTQSKAKIADVLGPERVSPMEAMQTWIKNESAKTPFVEKDVPTDKLKFTQTAVDNATLQHYIQDPNWNNEHGTKTPVSGVENPDGSVSIVDGTHRGAAAILRGDPSIKVRVHKSTASPSSGMPSYSTLMSYKKVPGPSGSNPIEWRQATDGKTFAVKPTPAARAYNELAAGLVYKAAGVKFPNTAVVKDSSGKTYVVSEKVNDLHQLSPSGWMGKPDLQEKAAKDYGVDALLSHWDVHGLGADNTLVDNEDNPVRIESGGAMAYRAMGAPKPSFAKGQPWVEPKTMRDSEQGKRMYGKMTDAQAVDSLKSAAALNIDDIKQQWLAAGVPSAQADEWAAVLKERQAQIPGIIAKLGGTATPTPVAKTYTPADVKLTPIAHPSAHAGGSGLDAKGNPLKAYQVTDKQTGEHLGRVMQYRSVTTHHVNSAQAKSGSQFTVEKGWLHDRREPGELVSWSKAKKVYNGKQSDALGNLLNSVNAPTQKMLADFDVDTR